MPKKFNFRPARTADLESLVELYSGFIEGRSVSAAYVGEFLSNSPQEVFVATSQGAVVAACQLVVYGNVIRHPQKKAIIDSVVVQKAARRSGVGSFLVRASFQELFGTRNCELVTITTGYNRKGASEFYRELEMTEYGRAFTLNREQYSGLEGL